MSVKRRDGAGEISSNQLGMSVFRPAVAALGLVIWLAVVWLYPSAWQQAAVIGLSALFFTLLLVFPIDFFNIQFSLTQITFLGVGLVYGVEVAAWAAVLGGAVGSVLGAVFKNLPRRSVWQVGLNALYELGLVLVPFAISNTFIPWQDQLYLDILAVFQVSSVFVFCHSALILIGTLVVNRQDMPKTRQVLALLMLVELLALPFLLISVMVAPGLGISILVISGGVPAMLSIFLNDTQATHKQLARRVQDLSLLDRFSAVVRHATHLDDLLNALHNQTTDLLGVGNFYVALYNSDRNTIWYPIAIKAGIPQGWEERPVTNRLTDQVIERRTAILLTGNIDAGLKKIGAPPSDGDLQAWLGVPLQTPAGLLGCLAVFSETPGVSFTEDDQVLLTALSGQVSAALENILRMEEAGETLSRQAQQLDILEQIGRQLTATLQADELFSQILAFALDFTHSPTGSISVREQHTHQLVHKAQTGVFAHPDEIDALIRRVMETAAPEIVLFEGYSGAQLCVPILYQGEVMGAITLQSGRPDEYSGNEMAFISRLAQQAALAIRNASLFEQAQFRLREQAILSMVSSRLVSAQTLDDVLTSVAESVSAYLDSALTGVYLWTDNRRTLSLEAVMQREDDLGVTLPPEIPDDDLEEVSGLGQEPLLLSGMSPLAAHMVGPDAAYQVVLLPLMTSGDLLGMVASWLPPQTALAEGEMQLPLAIAAQGASAIQNALLFKLISDGRDRLRTVIDTVDDGVVMVDEDGKVIISNIPIADLAGFKVQDIIGKTLNSISEDFLQILGLTSQQAHLFAGGPAHVTKELSAPHQYPYNGRFYERYAAPVLSDQGQVLGWVLVVRDTTDERMLNQTREMLTETLMHDLRSPMGAIKTTLELLAENLVEQPQDPVASQALEIADRAADRVLVLVNSLMDISRLESDQMELNLQQFDAQKLIGEVLEEMLPQAREDQVMLSASHPPMPVLVKADRALVRRVLENLVDNALKFTPEGGLVEVSARQVEDGKVQLTVSDSGPGIPVKFRQEVFSRFVQVPGARGRRRGAGLGLAFCKVVAQAHDEEIWIEEGSGGIGTAVIFTLPAAPKQG